MQTEKSKEEAARLLAKYYGCKAILTFNSKYDLDSDGVSIEENITGARVISLVDLDNIKSFQIVLRSKDEMTAEEKNAMYVGLPSPANIIQVNAWRTDYLRSIGVATNEEDRNLIIIKN